MLTKQLESYRPFANRFVSAFAPEILKAYLHEVELYISRQEWMSDRIACHVLNFLEERYASARPSLSEAHALPASSQRRPGRCSGPTSTS